MLLRLDGPLQPPAAGGRPRHIVILLHGLGADGSDLLGLAPYWGRLLPHALFLAPNAPFPCDMAPYGFQWFSLQDRTPEMMLGGVRAAAPMLESFIDETLEEHGLDERALALVGFSQGTMMSLHVGLRRERPVAGILGFSGALVGADGLGAEIRSKPPVLLVHGDADEIVPVQAMDRAAEALRGHGVAVETLRRPGLPHSIDEGGLAHGGAFLMKRLSAPAGAD